MHLAYVCVGIKGMLGHAMHLHDPRPFRALFILEKIGKYTIIRQLGAGATSKVFLALDTFSDQQVALKLVELNSIHDKTSAKALKKLLQVEASLVGKLHHPHIVQMLEAVITDDISYIVMEYINGGTLEKYAEADLLFPFNTVAELMYKCCKALEYAQTKGVIHRDIKPANLLLQGECDVKISDFGAAMVEDGDSTTVSGVGSLTYMSPEQITGETLTHQTDIYSLGVTMSKLLTGKVPFKATSTHGVMYEKVNGEQPPPKTYRPEIPDELDAIVQRATRKDMPQRYKTWGDFAYDLASFLNLNDKKRNVRFNTEKIDALRATPFFGQFGEIELGEVLHFSKWHKVSKGTSILKEGHVGNSFFILTTGIAKVLKSGKIVSFLHKGDCFGEIKRLPNSVYFRTTGIEAGTDCILFEVDLDVLATATLVCRFQFDEAFLHLLLKRLDSANTRISKLLGPEEDFGTLVKAAN